MLIAASFDVLKAAQVDVHSPMMSPSSSRRATSDRCRLGSESFVNKTLRKIKNIKINYALLNTLETSNLNILLPHYFF